MVRLLLELKQVESLELTDECKWLRYFPFGFSFPKFWIFSSIRFIYFGNLSAGQKIYFQHFRNFRINVKKPIFNNIVWTGPGSEIAILKFLNEIKVERTDTQAKNNIGKGDHGRHSLALLCICWGDITFLTSKM